MLLWRNGHHKGGRNGIWCNIHGSVQGFQLTPDRPRVVVGLFDVANCLIVSLPKLEAIDRLELGT